MARARRKVNLSDINDPKGITLTKSPANQTGFKVIRSEEETPKDNAPPLLAIDVFEGATNSDAENVRDTYALADYELVEDEGRYRLQQATYASDIPTIPVNIGNGNIAKIATSAFDDVAIHAPVTRSETHKTSLPVLSQLSFSKEQFPDAKAVDAWLNTYEVSYSEKAVQRTEEGHTVTRSHLIDEDSHDVKLDKGVTGKVTRGDEQDVPTSVYRAVTEQVYGYYADWEFVDFAVAMANPDYIHKSSDAIWVLKDVLHNIMLYSTLNVTERKELIRQALSSYADYMITLLDSLPIPVTTQERSDKSSSILETDTMTKKTVVKEVEDEAATQSTESESEITTKEDFVTRSELKEIFVEVLEEHAIKRSDEATSTKEADGEQKVERTDETPATDPLKVIADAMSMMATRMDSVETKIDDTAKAVAEQEDSVTITRTEDETSEEVQRSKDASPFTGMFGDRLTA